MRTQTMLPLGAVLLALGLAEVQAGAEEKTAKVAGTFTVPKELDSIQGQVVEIRLYKIHPMIADKPADLVERVEIKDFNHVKGTETKKEFVIGAKAKLEPEMKYYLTLFILKDGRRTHMGYVPGKFLITVLTQGNPNTVAITVKKVLERV